MRTRDKTDPDPHDSSDMMSTLFHRGHMTRVTIQGVRRWSLFSQFHAAVLSEWVAVGSIQGLVFARASNWKSTRANKIKARAVQTVLADTTEEIYTMP